MPNTADQNQDNEANPIAEIFDEVFTLMQDLETRSVAVFEYLQEQGGATDEKLAPYLDRAAGASDVRWRAARARMEHLLAPKPKSSTELAKEDKARGASQRQEGKDADSGAKSQGETQQSAKSGSIDSGKELASAPTGTDQTSEKKVEKSQSAKPAVASKAKVGERGSDRSNETPSRRSDAETQAASLAQGAKSETEKDAKPEPAENADASHPRSSEDKQQSRIAAK